MGLSFAFGTLILVLVLLRQSRIRPVPRYFAARLPLFVGVIGLFEFFAYTGTPPPFPTATTCGCSGRCWSGRACSAPSVA